MRAFEKIKLAERPLPRIAFIGNLANIGFYLVRFFRDQGSDAHLYLSQDEPPTSNPLWKEKGLSREALPWIHYFDDSALRNWARSGKNRRRLGILGHLVSLRRELKTFDVAVTVGMLNVLGPFLSLPHIAFATGADLKEVAWEKSLKGCLMRKAFQKADLAIVLADETYLRSVERLGLKNIRFFRYPVDPHASSLKPFQGASAGVLRLFHPSNIFFVKKHAHSATTKGTDRFLRAFIRYVKEGHKVHLVLLERGPDVMLAREMLERGEALEHVTFFPELDRQQLEEQIEKSHLVVDQFDLGSFGMITVEAMQSGRAVLLRFNEDLAALRYEEMPPFFHADREEEIYARLCEAGSDLAALELRGKVCREWICRHHDAKQVVQEWFSWIEQVK